MANEWERQILREFIEIYSDLSCLWDVSSHLYKDKNEKERAWKLLVEKIKQLEPEANIATAKKKVDHLRTAYKREAKKVQESKGSGCKPNEVHIPNLWYFKLLTFLDKKDEQCRSGKETLSSDEESQQNEQESAKSCSGARKKCASDRGLNSKKQKLMATAQELLQQEHKTKPNSFAVYMGEQLEQVSTYQRQVAEKLISEVIFLAKTDNLNFDSKVETPSRSHNVFSTSGSYSYSTPHSPVNIKPPIQPSPSPQIMQPSPQYVLSTASPQFIQQPPSSYPILTEDNDTAKSILKELLIVKEPK